MKLPKSKWFWTEFSLLFISIIVVFVIELTSNAIGNYWFLIYVLWGAVIIHLEHFYRKHKSK